MTALKIGLLLACTLILSESFSQNNKNSIIIGKKEKLFSKVLNEQREIWVHIPGNFSKGQTVRRYPVVYLLDGDANFYALTGTIRELSTEHANTIVPEMIIVGITNTDRTRDLTITHKTTGFGVDPEFAKNSGGAEKFTSFIEKELIPYVDSAYPAAPYRMLVGHSLGGMVVVNALLNHTEMFNSYVAIDPSLWWDEQLLVKQAQSVLKQKKFNNKTFFMAVANSINTDMDTAEIKKDTTENTLAIRDKFEFINVLNNNKENGLRWQYNYFKEENHSSVPLIGQYNALRFIFDFHKLAAFGQLFDPGFNADSAISAQYKNITENMGYKVLPPEEFVNGLGHAYLESSLVDKAEGVFKLNLRNYPESPVAYAAMGDLYAAKADNKAATDYYKKSLAIKDDPQLREIINGLVTKK